MHTLDRPGRSVKLGGIVLRIVAIAWTLTSLGCSPVRSAATSPATPLGRPTAARRIAPPLTRQVTRPAVESGTRREQLRGQLRASGRWLVYPDGSRFR